MFRKLSFTVILICNVLAATAFPAHAATGPGHVATGDPAEGRGAVIHRGLGGEPDVLDPHKTTLNVEVAILTDLYEGLVKQDAEGKVVAGVARTWDLSADGLTWTFHLRDGLKWSDGGPLVAEDFVRSARRLFTPKTASPNAIFLFGIRNSERITTGAAEPETLGVRAPAPQTVIIELSSPDPYFLQLISQVLLVPWPEEEADGRAIKGNGPFILSDWQPFSTITLNANPHYYGSRDLRLAKVIYHTTPDPASAVKRFRAGELDVSPGVPAAQYEELKALVGDKLRSGRAFSTSYLGINLDIAPLDDARVRMAILLAMEREVITDRILRAGQVPSWRYTPDLLTDYPLTLLPFADKDSATRRAEAIRLLAEAGYGSDNPLHLGLRYIGDDGGRMTAVAIRSMLASVSVNVDVRTSDLKTHYSDLVMGKYELALVGWTANPDPSSFLISFEHAGGANTFNISHYNNAVFDGHMAHARTLVGMKERNAAFVAAEEHLLADAALVPLYAGVTHALVQDKVKGYHIHGTGQSASEYLWIKD